MQKPQAALYEPGLVTLQKWEWLDHYRKYLNEGKDRDAFTEFVRGMHMSPLSKAPHWLAKAILCLAIKGDDWELKRKHLITNLREHEEVKRLAGSFSPYSAITIPILLIGGEKSNTTVKSALEKLLEAVPQHELQFIPGQEHFAPENGQAPHLVADMIRHYLD